MQRLLWGVLALCFAALPSSAAITGVVMNQDGQPVAGARVSIRAFETAEAARTRLLSAAPEAVPMTSAQTDAKGTFSLESPKEATVDLTVYARGYEPHHRRIERDEEVGAIALQKSETRKGSVTAGGKPVAGATVVIHYGAYEYQAKTDDKGNYEAPDPKRSNAIFVVHPDYAVDSETIFALNGASASVLQRKLFAGSAFQGRVVTGDKDTPVAKATVLVDSWPLATSGDDGAFTIAHMPARWKTITAQKDSLIGQRTFGKETSTVIRIAKGATVAGRITDAKTRLPVAGAVVSVMERRFGPGMNVGVSALTDAKGTYSLLVPAGTYMVLASHPGYSSQPADAGAVAGQQTSKDVPMAPMARVSGLVLDESKRPVVVAVLDTESAESMGMGIPRRMMRGFGMSTPIVSGPDGRFSMRVEPDEAIWVRATKRGMPSAKSDSMQLAAGERKSGLVLTIPTGIAVSGRAIDTQGDPLSGVTVTATEAEGGNQRMMMRMIIGGLSSAEDDVRTASDGTFTMRVKEGTYDFTFRREGLAPKTVRGQNVTVTSSPNIEATLEPAVEVSGRVTRGGMGLENVMIFAMAPGGNNTSATTGPDGSFTLSGLSAGSVRIMARKEDDFVQETRTVTAPANDVLIDVAAGGRITGRVVEKGSSKPITSFQAGITTSRGGGGGMVMMGPPQLRSFTSDDGTFTLDSIPPGATVLIASAPGYASGRLNVNVEAGKELRGVELQLDAGVKLTGRVTGAGGSALSDVQVRILPSPTGGFASNGMERSATTDANGEYSIDSLEPGEESISFSHPKHSNIRKSVTLKGRETRLDVQLDAGGRVTGTVVTESSAPVGDAQVEASSNAGFESARTDANGSFTFESVTPGRYRFTASKTGFAEGVVEDVDISTGAPVRIVLKTGGTIYGRITGLTAQELPLAQVSASGQSYQEGSIDASGNYRIEGVSAGSVRVQASSGSGIAGASRRSAVQTVDLAPGGSQQVDIAFNDDVVIRGRVTRNGVPLPGATVNFYPRGASSRASGSSPTDNDGLYSVRGLDEGEYNVLVNDQQRMSPFTATYQVRGSSTYDIDYKTNALRGRVLDLSTNEPLANVTVQLRNIAQTEGPRPTRGGLTDATGSFILDSVPPGNYTVSATKDGFGNDTKDLYVGESAIEDLELHLASNGGVTFNVVDARDGRSISARAFAYDLQGRIVDETRMSFGGGDSGSVKLSVAPGNYSATIWAEGYAPRNISFQAPSTQTVALSPGGTLQVRSKHNNPVRVRLIDASGIPCWRFSNWPTSRELPPTTGTTTFSNIAAGTYTLQLMENETVVDSKRIVVQEGQTTTEEI